MQKRSDNELLNILRKLGNDQDIRQAVQQARESESTHRTPFHQKYWNDPVGFCNDCLSWKPGETGLAPYQKDVLEAIPREKRVSVRAPRGAGKSLCAAAIVHWFALTRDGVTDWKIVTTAGGLRQLVKFLWPEIHRISRRIKWIEVGRSPYNTRTELFKHALELKTGQAFAANSDNPALIEGAHAESILYILDEAKIIPDEVFDAIEGSFSGSGEDTNREAFVFMISTPGPPEGRFYQIQSRKPGYEDWYSYHITVEQAVEAGRLSRDWVEKRRAQWGENSPLFLNHVLGQFYDTEQEGVIPLQWVLNATERYLNIRDKLVDV